MFRFSFSSKVRGHYLVQQLLV